MIPLMIIFMILCSGSFIFAAIFKKKFEETIAINIMAIILIIYFSGILGFLKQGVYIVIGLSCIMYLYTIYTVIKRKNLKEVINNIVTPGFLAFTLFYIFFIIVHRGRLCVNWDEFSHWGDVVKVMFNINDFGTNPESMSTFKSYPPGMAIFQYFWMIIGGTFREWYLYISYQIFAVALFLPMLKNVKWKEIIILIIVILFIPIIIYSSYYGDISIDAIVGIIFGYILSNVLLSKDYGKFEILKLILSISVLILLKDAGTFLAAISIIIIILDILFVKDNIFGFKNWSKEKKKEYKKTILKIFLLITMIIIVKTAWNKNIEDNNVKKSFGKPMITEDLIKSLLGRQEMESYKKETINNFIERLGESNFVYSNFVKVNYYALLTILSLLMYLIYIYQSKNKDMQFNKRLKLVNITALIGFIVYTLGLLLLYITKFSEYEAIRLASFERYIGIYAIGLIGYIAMIYVYVMKDIEETKRKVITAIILAILVLFVPINAIVKIITVRSSQTIITRNKYNVIERLFKSQAQDNKKNIYLIAQNTSGYDFLVSKFILRPNNITGWSIGKQYGEKDIWTINMTSEEWKKTLINQFDYVYIIKQDDQFVNQFGNLFRENNNKYISNNKLYEVNKKEEKLVLVNKVVD